MSQISQLQPFVMNGSSEPLRERATSANGLREAENADYTKPFTACDSKQLDTFVQKLDPKVQRKLDSIFKGGASGRSSFADAIAGKEYTPESFRTKSMEPIKGLLAKPSEAALNVFQVAPIIELASQAGIHLQIAPDSDVGIVGFMPPNASDPSQEAQDKVVKSGRCFMSTRERGSRDTSDVDYLKDLGSYLAKASDMSLFGELLSVLTRGNTAGFESLSPLGQSVLADFTGIYTAELLRNVAQPSHRWMNDLAEVTLLSAYGAASGKVMKGDWVTDPKTGLNHMQNLRMEDGSPVDYFGANDKSGRSGIGETRPARRALQRAISQAAERLAPGVVDTLRNLIGGKKGGDLYEELMLYLNDDSKQAEIQAHADELDKAVLDFLTLTREKATEITQDIQAHLPAPTGEPAKVQ